MQSCLISVNKSAALLCCNKRGCYHFLATAPLLLIVWYGELIPALTFYKGQQVSIDGSRFGSGHAMRKTRI